MVLSCSGAASPKPAPPEREEGPLGGHRCSGCLHPTSMPTACLGPKSACCLAYPPSSNPRPFLSTPPGLSKDRAGMTLGRLEVRLRMLDLAWVWSLSLSGQEHRPRLLTWALPHPSSVPTPRRGHTPSAIRTVRSRGEYCESKPVHLPGGTRLLKKKKMYREPF